MARSNESLMYFLDTHIVAWLYQKSVQLLSPKARKAIEENDIFISPIVSLELEYLFEIGRIKTNSETIVSYLKEKIGLKMDETDFKGIIDGALREKWTRDPFDRIIVAHSRYRKAPLVSKDKEIAKHYPKTVF